MTNKKDLQDWLNGLPADDCIGVDEGGLTLESKLTGQCYELGGMPEDEDDA